MRTKISFKWSLFVIAFVLITFSIKIYWIYSIPPVKNFYLDTNYSSPKTSVGIPIRISIPSLNIDTDVEEVGLTSDGSVGVPKLPNDVAWFDLGPRPGEIGSSVIDGHSGYKDNMPAVFDSLDKLKKGDEIYVENEIGEITVFMVRDFESYGQNTYPLNIFSSNDGKAHLNLITCSGFWNATDQTHSLRLVVFADKIFP
jgi:LPXTG-site transpeptidase (sortase) family protein